MKIATWNVNSLGVRLPQVLDWLSQHQVDVLGMQELKLTDDKFPVDAFKELGYHAEFFGQKTYNGVAVVSRTPLQAPVRNIPGFEDEQARVLSVTVPGTPEAQTEAQKPIRVVNGYFVNGQAPGTDKFAYKMQWLAHLRAYLASELAQHERLVLLGDFNITADDRDTWDPVGLKDTIHHTQEERQALQELVALGLQDAFRLFEQPEKTFSWWDYRMLGFQKNRGLRIDYVMVSQALRPLVRQCHIDRQPRKNKQPSDHAPVVLELG